MSAAKLKHPHAHCRAARVDCARSAETCASESLYPIIVRARCALVPKINRDMAIVRCLFVVVVPNRFSALLLVILVIYCDRARDALNATQTHRTPKHVYSHICEITTHAHRRAWSTCASPPQVIEANTRGAARISCNYLLVHFGHLISELSRSVCRQCGQLMFFLYRCSTAQKATKRHILILIVFVWHNLIYITINDECDATRILLLTKLAG